MASRISGASTAALDRSGQYLARLLRVAGLAKLAGMQQGHPRLAREAFHRFAHDAFGQFRLLQRLRQPAEGQPGLQIRRDGAGVDETIQQPRRQRRIAAAAAQHGQCVAPAHVVLVAQQRIQFALRAGRIVSCARPARPRRRAWPATAARAAARASAPGPHWHRRWPAGRCGWRARPGRRRRRPGRPAGTSARPRATGRPAERIRRPLPGSAHPGIRGLGFMGAGAASRGHAMDRNSSTPTVIRIIAGM